MCMAPRIRFLDAPDKTQGGRAPPCQPPGGYRSIRHACKLGLEGIVLKRLGSRYRSGRSPDWIKMKNPACAAVHREAEEDWGR
jgi:ATP-dependent DNA ligase